MSVQERIEKYTLPEPNSGCWLWIGACGSSGYPQLTVIDEVTGRPKSVRLHRYVCEQTHGSQNDLYALHKCDVKVCLNPAHIYYGTQKENVSDAYARGKVKSKAGENSKLNKLTWSDVEEIRSSSETNVNLSKKYGVAPSRISEVRAMKAWRKNG